MATLQIVNTLSDLIRLRDEFVTENSEPRTVSDVLECEYGCADNPAITENIDILRKLVNILDA